MISVKLHDSCNIKLNSFLFHLQQNLPFRIAGKEHKVLEKIAEIIMNTLPVCSERQMSYSTFTIVDIEHDGLINILEFDNPQTIVLRDNKPFDPVWK